MGWDEQGGIAGVAAALRTSLNDGIVADAADLEARRCGLRQICTLSQTDEAALWMLVNVTAWVERAPGGERSSWQVHVRLRA